MKRFDFGMIRGNRSIINSIFSGIVVSVFLFLVLDGLADVLIAGSAGIREKGRVKAAGQIVQEAAEAGGLSLAENLDPFLGMEFKTVPGIGPLPKPMDKGEVTIVDYGRRLAPGESLNPAKPRVLILGASQIFGLYNRADGTVAAHLDRLMPGVAFMNYGTIGQTMDASAAHLDYLIHHGVLANGVVVIGGAMEPLLYCLFEPMTATHDGDINQLRLTYVFQRIKRLILPGQRSLPCARDPEKAEAVASRTVAAIRAVVATARAHDIDIAVMVLPQPWLGKANLSNLPQSALLDLHTEAIGPAAQAVLEHLRREPIPEVFDLTGIFRDAPPYFVDAIGHLSDEGQKVLAQAIRDLIVEKNILPGVTNNVGAEPLSPEDP